MKTKTAKSTGRIISLAILAHLLLGLIIPYLLLQPLKGSLAHFLSVAAGMAVQVKLSVALLFIGGILPIALTIMTWPILRRRKEPVDPLHQIISEDNELLEKLSN